MKVVVEQLKEAHEAAYKVYSVLSEVTEQLRASVDVDGDFEAQIEELTEIADELQSTLFDLLEGKENGCTNS